jgi:hypothetical protein
VQVVRATEDAVPIVFGQVVNRGMATGLAVRPDGSWSSVSAPVGMVSMRFPRRSRPEPFAAAFAGLTQGPRIPIVNPLEFSDLTADKVATQAAIEGTVPLPEIETDVGRFQEMLGVWDAAFLKPRYGSLGEGVQYLRAGRAIPEVPPGEWLIQRAVSPPRGVAGVALRVLVQRACATDPATGWVVPSAVARISDHDPTVSVERGARVTLASDVVDPSALGAVHDDAVAVAVAMSSAGSWDPLDVVEMGVDFVVDQDGRPWVVEVNSIPRGRLAVLAALDPRLASEHEAAIRRPLRLLVDRLRA